MKKKLIFIATFICSLNIWCTEITEVVTKQVGDNIEIKYSIADADPHLHFLDCGQKHAVNNVDHSVRSFNVGLRYLGTTNKDTAFSADIYSRAKNSND